MELVYLFIKYNNKIQSQNLNFGSEYIFKYSVENKCLSVEKNELYIKDFFKSSKQEVAQILNVTSIIGENGSGKTSILKLISQLLTKRGTYTNLTFPVVFIIKEQSEFKVYHTVDLPIENSLEGYNFKVEVIQKNNFKYPPDIEPLIHRYEFEGFENLNTIYFSNVLNIPDYKSNLGYNISTNKLLVRDFYLNSNIKFLTKVKNNVDKYIISELFRKIYFIANFKEQEIIPFNIPEYLVIEMKDYWDLKIDIGKSDPNKDYSEYRSEVRPFHYYLTNDLEEFVSNRNEYLKWYYIYLVYFSTYSNIVTTLQPNDDLFEKIKNIFLDRYIKRQITVSNLIEYLREITGELYILTEIKNLEEKIENVIKIIELIKKIDDTSTLNFIDDKLVYKLNFDNTESFLDFIEIYSNSIINESYFLFKWRDISSGEKAFLDIFSRFYSLSNNVLKGRELSKNLLILIDEGDLYLHPAWQKKFVKMLIDFLPIFYKETTKGEKRTIQIIFTTNSPIPASDMLSYNTIFLECPDESNVIVKDSLNDQKETFAANIHTLLSDSFFVKDGLIGNFAVSKIDEVINNLIKRKDLSWEERENMRKIIHQIGEPVLRVKLMQMYKDRYDLEIHERLEDFEGRLKRLEDDKD